MADMRRPAPAFHRAVNLAALGHAFFGITRCGTWFCRLQPAINMQIELIRWSSEQVPDAISEAAEDPPEELVSLLERDRPRI